MLKNLQDVDAGIAHVNLAFVVHRYAARTGEVANIDAGFAESTQKAAIPVKGLNAKITRIKHVQRAIWRDCGLQGHVELAIAIAPGTDHLDFFSILVINDDLVLIAFVVRAINRVNTLPVATDCHAGRPFQVIGAAYGALEQAQAVKYQHLAPLGVGDIHIHFRIQRQTRRFCQYSGQALTKAEHFAEIRKIVPDSFFLVPGIGAQNGSLSEVCRYGMNDAIGLLINSSRAIIYASDQNDFAEKAREAAQAIQIEMQQLLKGSIVS